MINTSHPGSIACQSCLDLQAEVERLRAELEQRQEFVKWWGNSVTVGELREEVDSLHSQVERLKKQVAQWRDHATIGDETKKRLLAEVERLKKERDTWHQIDGELQGVGDGKTQET